MLSVGAGVHLAVGLLACFEAHNGGYLSDRVTKTKSQALNQIGVI